jgi:hypothetical protein
MRLSIPAAFLAAVLVWPAGAGSAKAEDLVSVVHCAGRLFANGILNYKTTNDASSIEAPALLYNTAAYARFKETRGAVPEYETYQRFYDAVAEEAKVFIGSFDMQRNRWSDEAQEELVACYDALIFYVFTEGMDILDESELERARLHTALQTGNLRNSE